MLLRIILGLIPISLAMMYVLGVWRSFKMGRYAWRQERPFLFGFVAACALFAVSAATWTGIEFISGHQ
jgi:amino acid permease